MAGGGVRGGLSHGETDDYGYEAVSNKVQIHDLHATILALLGARPRKTDFPLCGPRFPPDGHGRQCGEGHYRVIAGG
jgi:hypothetical protein